MNPINPVRKKKIAQIKTIHKAYAGAMLWILILGGCAAVQREKIPAESIVPETKRHLELYADFVKENIAEINAHYSTTYVPYAFIVDIDDGSTAIQDLIDPASVARINAVLRTDAASRYPYKARRIYQYILSRYDYDIDPHQWQSVEETIRTQKGDCKSLSLLLMSLLTSAGLDAYAGISNGHMWVVANENNRWQVLDLDQNPARRKIYSIPGFYDDPLYKIYPDRSEKRKRVN
ncbi:MAG: transglutaminase domain-containing protein [Desulfobacterales bacterium]